MTILRVEGLTKTFAGVSVIDALSFTIASGAIHSIIGPNGAGKTTLLNLISGLYMPNAGRIFLGDTDITGLMPHALAGHGIARTFQNLQIFFNMTAVENVMVGRHLRADRGFLAALLGARRIMVRDAECREMAEEIMRFVGIGGYIGSDTGSMPYGALKRLEIARALAAEPRMMLLDEPAAGLNPVETGAIDDLIQAIAETGTTVVLVEHDMRLVMGVSDHILVLEAGRKLAEGGAREIRHDPKVVEAYLGHAGRNR